MKTPYKRLWIGLIMSVMIACIIYFGCKLASAQQADFQIDNNPALSLHDIENVIVPDSLSPFEKEYEGFKVYFNPSRHTASCVVWTLHKNETSGSSQRSNKFWTDSDVEGCADYKDYSRSGFDRGHLCPAGEQKWSPQAMHNSFVMTNICPQRHELNSGAWKTLEDKERLWANRDSILVIAAGPIYYSPNPATIGFSKVAVPDAFFKVLLAPLANPMRAIAFVYPNMKCPGNMSNYATNVDEVERITGLDFFSSLPDDIENEIEATASFKEWNSK